MNDNNSIAAMGASESSRNQRGFTGMARPSSPHATATMQANRRRDTAPELQIRSLLHRMGLRFRVDRRISLKSMTARPDLVFPTAKVAVFVDGCFWHSCPIHGELPRANRGFWQEKLRRNVERDSAQNAALNDAGWNVLRIWEHENPDAAANRIAKAVRERTAEI